MYLCWTITFFTINTFFLLFWWCKSPVNSCVIVTSPIDFSHWNWIRWQSCTVRRLNPVYLNLVIFNYGSIDFVPWSVHEDSCSVYKVAKLWIFVALIGSRYVFLFHLEHNLTVSLLRTGYIIRSAVVLATIYRVDRSISLFSIVFKLIFNVLWHETEFAFIIFFGLSVSNFGDYL